MAADQQTHTVPDGQVKEADLVSRLAAAEEHLAALRATRDAHVREEHQSGASKYALAKRWQVTENTITRILSR